MSGRWILFFTLLTCGELVAQGRIEGTVQSESGAPLQGMHVYLKHTAFGTFTDNQGAFSLYALPEGNYVLEVSGVGYDTLRRALQVDSGPSTSKLRLTLRESTLQLKNVTIGDRREATMGVRRLRSVEGAGIYEAKKNEVIELQDLTANLATNNPRQIYSRVPGLNIYESDGAGLQLGIGARGLDPSRTANFNVRQNGYEISADALGYPESYYTPATESVDRIEIVRGAASLQYGTQFGGLLNFVQKSGPDNRKLAVTSRNTGGSFGYFNTYNSLGGTIGKVNYYAFFQYKRGDGWRDNSGFNSKMAYMGLEYEPSDRLSVKFQYTFMDYLAQQPGGLTDALFEEDPRQSIRGRNWFAVNWNLFANIIDWRITNGLKLNVRTFGLLGGRDAVGNLGRIDRIDDLEERDLFKDDFRNLGNETRLMYHYRIGNQPAVALVGVRMYQGHTDRKQGLGTDGDDANFSFLNPDDLEFSDYDFPGTNFSVFAEHIFNLTQRFSITPGVRIEYLRTDASGYYKDRVLIPDPDTGFAVDSVFRVQEELSRTRAFPFFGMGVSFKLDSQHEVYGNFSQNFRSINFNDIRTANPNFVVDPDIRDERGFNLDLGFRGHKSGRYDFDISAFYLRYDDRIGAILQVDPETFRLFRYRTNISDAYSMGIEAFGEARLFTWNPETYLNLFGNFSLIQAEYVNSEESGIEGNQVELVPPITVRSGLNFTWKRFRANGQFSYTHEHYSDASNAESTPTAVAGLIPSYYVVDLSVKYRVKFVTLEASLNNLTNNLYFTRRAVGYPGPGIIPSDGRSFYFTVEVAF